MNGNPGNILLVADHTVINETLFQASSFLEQQLVVVNEAQQALILVGAGSFEVVLFAVCLPDMTAQEFLARMQNIGGMEAIATIAIGDPDQSRELEQCLEAGADDFMITPINAGLLKARVRSVLEHKRLRYTHEHSLKNEELLKIEHDIQVARRIQAGFLPETLPKPRGWDVAARFSQRAR